MLTHQTIKAENPNRVVVLGSNGFIASAIMRRLKAVGIKTLGLGRNELNLLEHKAGDKLARLLEPRDVVIFTSARAPCKDLQMLSENIKMATSVISALMQKQVSHVIYISSDAVYRDTEIAITEASCAEPSSLHGVMHLTREVALRQSYLGRLAIVRPTLVYGYDDPHNGYGPNRFRRLASTGSEIILFGEGEERRDHVHVEDVGELVQLIVTNKSTGIVNAVSGELVSFRELAEFISAGFSTNVQIKTTPRLGLMPHNGYRAFNNTNLIKAFPDFRFKGWREGISEVNKRNQFIKK